MTDSEFLAAFEARALDRTQWTHAAHVRMAWLYATRTADPLPLVRAGIQKLNATFVRPEGAAPDPRGLDGYHETITTAFVRVIAARATAGETFEAFAERNPDLFDRGFPALLVHYSPERLFSAEARTAFVPPDRAALPRRGNFCVTSRGSSATLLTPAETVPPAVIRVAVMSSRSRGLAVALPLFVACVALAADPLEAEQYEEKCIARAAERAARVNKTDRAKWMHELEAAFPGKVANALTEDEYATWFDLLAGKSGEWRRDESPTPEIAALFDRVVQRLELGPVPGLTREEFKKFAKRVLRDGNPPSEAPDPNEDADRAFRVLDRDASGELEAEEYTPPLKADKLRTDADANGRITKDEYRAFFKRVVATKAEAIAAKNGDTARADPKGAKGKAGPALPTWFAALDADGDGQVSLFEWRKGGKPVAMFTDMDLNGDGLLTRDEYVRYAKMTDDALKQKQREKEAEEREKK